MQSDGKADPEADDVTEARRRFLAACGRRSGQSGMQPQNKRAELSRIGDHSCRVGHQ